MSVAKVIELSSSSSKSIEDAVQSGLRKCAESVKNIKGAWVSDIKVVTDGAGEIFIARAVWASRDDRYSEERSAQRNAQRSRVEMYEIGG